MEAAGLAVGVPGLALILWDITNVGLKVIADCKDLPAEHQRIVHRINIEKQKLDDWERDVGRKLSHDPEPSERERHRLIFQSMALIAHLFTDINLAEREYTSVAQKSDDAPRKSFTARVVPAFFRKKQDSTAATHAPSALVESSLPSVVPGHIMSIDQLRHFGERVAKSRVSTKTIKWALLDKERLQDLHRRLRQYTKGLLEISEALLKSGKLFPLNRGFGPAGVIEPCTS